MSLGNEFSKWIKKVVTIYSFDKRLYKEKSTKVINKKRWHKKVFFKVVESAIFG